MNEIVELLMKRDGISRNEAELIVDECAEAIDECARKGDYFGAEDAIRDYLGLEPDYLENFLL